MSAKVPLLYKDADYDNGRLIQITFVSNGVTDIYCWYNSEGGEPVVVVLLCVVARSSRRQHIIHVPCKFSKLAAPYIDQIKFDPIPSSSR